MKLCANCSISKEESNFGKDARTVSGICCYCKECKSVIAKRWQARNYDKYTSGQKRYRDANREKINAAARKYAKENPEKGRANKLKRLCGITIEQHTSKLIEQEHKCPGCKGELIPGRETHTDHCHSTGKFRGLLCRACNTTLGLIKDNFDTALNLARYIQEHAGTI